MKRERSNTTLLVVIGIATLLVAVVGATFAFFSAQVTYNDTNSTLTITSAAGGTSSFAGGDTLQISNIYPREEVWAAKTIYLTYKNDNAESNFNYKLNLVYKNQFSSGYITYKLTPITTTSTPSSVCKSNGMLDTTACGGAANMTTSDSNGTLATAVTNGSFSNTSTETTVQLGTGSFAKTSGSEVHHVYLLEIFFPDTGESQNEDQGKVLSARVTYEEVLS